MTTPSPDLNRVENLRKLSPAELEGLGQQSLRDHLLAQAAVARDRYPILTENSMEAMLRDPLCLRYPVRLVFEFGEMALHQFAQPDIDWRNTSQDGRVLYVRPLLKNHPELLPFAVAYMIPVINYGNIVTDAHCLAFGTELLGLTEDTFYSKLCSLADLLGVESKSPDTSLSSPCGCSK